MATPQQLARLHRLIWLLVYVGLLTVFIGFSTLRADEDLGRCLMAGGALVAAVGVLLIYLRSRLRADPPPKDFS
ncbi:MAG: hypothetical protein V4738_11325 [Pseudomonadota bacterium]